MESMILKPSKDGLKVFNPATKLHLRKEGDEVVINNYWRRMIGCGDVVEVKKNDDFAKNVNEGVDGKSIYDLPKDHEQVAGYDPGKQYPQVVDEQAGETFNKQKNKKK